MCFMYYIHIYVYRYVSYTYFQFIELTRQSFVSPNARIPYDFPSRITGNSWPNQIQTHDMSLNRLPTPSTGELCSNNLIGTIPCFPIRDSYSAILSWG